MYPSLPNKLLLIKNAFEDVSCSQFSQNAFWAMSIRITNIFSVLRREECEMRRDFYLAKSINLLFDHWKKIFQILSYWVAKSFTICFNNSEMHFISFTQSGFQNEFCFNCIVKKKFWILKKDSVSSLVWRRSRTKPLSPIKYPKPGLISALSIPISNKYRSHIE